MASVANAMCVWLPGRRPGCEYGMADVPQAGALLSRRWTPVRADSRKRPGGAQMPFQIRTKRTSHSVCAKKTGDKPPGQTLDAPTISRHKPSRMKVASPSLAALILFSFAAIVLAQRSALTNSPSPPATTNVAPPIATNVPPPLVFTNLPPAIPPKPVMGASGSAVLATFGGNQGGKFSISGRTLKLPAQIAPPQTTNLWRRAVDFGMNLTKGNSETLRYTLGLEAVRETDQDLFRLCGRGAYGESDGNADTENANATLRYERLLTRTLYALGNLDWLTDPIADLDYRVTSIVSPGAHLVKSDVTLLNLEIGAGYIREKKVDSADGYAAGRIAANVERVLNAHVLAWSSVEYLPKLADPGIFFVNAEAGLSSVLIRQMCLNITLHNRYDSAPVDGKKSTDTTFNTALSVVF